jgi:hypothetical protein
MIGLYQNTVHKHIFDYWKYDAPIVLNINILPPPNFCVNRCDSTTYTHSFCSDNFQGAYTSTSARCVFIASYRSCCSRSDCGFFYSFFKLNPSLQGAK